MTSAQHKLWIARGAPEHVAVPVSALASRLRGHGYTVYCRGDDRHMDHIPPEDHTPYSETGWPVRTRYGWITAADVMPPPAGSGLPSLQRLGEQIYADKQANHPGAKWVKYMNWGPLNDKHAVQDRWQPDHRRGSSGDVGHIHLSARSDMIDYAGAAGYDPVARLLGQQPDDAQETPMPFVAHDSKTDAFYVCDLVLSREVPPEAVQDVLYLAEQLNYGHGKVTSSGEWSHDGWVREGWTERAFGTLLPAPAPTG